MVYTKPELLLVGRAVESVQSHQKQGGVIDSPSSLSSSAYEADE